MSNQTKQKRKTIKSNLFIFITVIFVHLLFISFESVSDTTASRHLSLGVGALGHIEPRSRVINVSHNAGAEGARIEHLLFKTSDQVKAGDVLAILSDHEKKKAQVEVVKTRILVLKAQRDTEQITLSFNEKEYHRYRSLEQDSMASISLAETKKLAFEQSRTNLNRLSAEIAHAESELDVAQIELKNTLVHAPIDGTVLKINARPSERIGDDGLLEIADLTQLDVVAEVYEADLSKIKVGHHATISAPDFMRPYQAQVRELGFLVRKNDLNNTDPLSDRDNRIIEVRLTLEPEAVATLQHQIYRQVQVRIEP